MGAKKTNDEHVLSVDDLMKEIDALQAKNAELELENGDLREHNDRLMKDNLRLEDRYDEEHKKRMQERDDAGQINAYLGKRVCYFKNQIKDAQERRKAEQVKRRNSIPKFVITAAVSLAMLIVPYTLQQMSAIGPQASFTIECILMMVIAWCYAIIWDRSRK